MNALNSDKNMFTDGIVLSHFGTCEIFEFSIHL